MALHQGVVARVFAKQVPEDQYGNTQLVSFKLENDENFYGCGKKKKPEIQLKIKDNWHTLKAGDKISFISTEAEVNGKTYFNVQSSKITLDTAGTGGITGSTGVSKPSTPSARPAAQSSPASSGKSSDYESGVVSGMALNNAVQLAIAKGDTSIDSIRAFAVDIIGLATELRDNFQAIKSGEWPPVAEKPAPRAKTKAKSPTSEEIEEANQQAAQAAADDFDDDIPF